MSERARTSSSTSALESRALEQKWATRRNMAFTPRHTSSEEPFRKSVRTPSTCNPSATRRPTCNRSHREEKKKSNLCIGSDTVERVECHGLGEKLEEVAPRGQLQSRHQRRQGWRRTCRTARRWPCTPGRFPTALSAPSPEAVSHAHVCAPAVPVQATC